MPRTTPEFSAPDGTLTWEGRATIIVTGTNGRNAKSTFVADSIDAVGGSYVAVARRRMGAAEGEFVLCEPRRYAWPAHRVEIRWDA